MDLHQSASPNRIRRSRGQRVHDKRNRLLSVKPAKNAYIQLYLDGGQRFSYRPNVSMIGGTLIFSIPSPPFLSRTAECSPAARIEIKLAV